ncbi:MAG TPA: cytochrome c [Usitatibacter sp.]|nr:cytochrome c [Usitatibacter sp.]
MNRITAAIALLASAAALPGAAAEAQAPSKAALCTTCHGPLGISVAPDAPNLAGQPRIYLVAQLGAYRSGKRTHEQMSLIAKGLSDADILELADWYSSIGVEARRPPAR